VALLVKCSLGFALTRERNSPHLAALPFAVQFANQASQAEQVRQIKAPHFAGGIGVVKRNAIILTKT
jgi:hypothetical protein